MRLQHTHTATVVFCTVNRLIDDDAEVRSSGDVMNTVGVEFVAADALNSDDSTSHEF